jgi:hypothetical protein
MKLVEWIEKNGGAAAKRRLHTDGGIRWATIHDAVNGRPPRRVDVAERISRATGGAVSVAEVLGLDEQPNGVPSPSAPTGEPGPVAA